jgi:hypothetical protein
MNIETTKGSTPVSPCFPWLTSKKYLNNNTCATCYTKLIWNLFEYKFNGVTFMTYHSCFVGQTDD